ncbi:MAG: AI-2E family transporter [Geminicoccaceae bacterium]
MRNRRNSPRGIARTLLWLFGLALALLFVATTINVLLLIFAGLLVGILLRACSMAVSCRTGLGPGLSLALVLIGLAALLAGAAFFLAPNVAVQLRLLADQLPKAWQELQDRLGWLAGDDAFQTLEARIAGSVRGAGGDVASQLVGAAWGTVGVIGAAILIFFIGVYLAADPGSYRRGIVALVPPPRRGRASEILDALGSTLLWWLIGKSISMTVVGVLTWIGLWLLDVPLPLTLSLIAALLTFVPNLGPVLAAAPAVLLAIPAGLGLAAWVLAMYVAVQTIESYLVTPLVQQRTVALPPALVISMQLIMGALAGAGGLALATPLTAAGLVLTRELYVRDVLDRRRSI